MPKIPKYPDPCEACEECKILSGCEKWRTRYLYRQKQINGYAEKVLKPKPTADHSKFHYEHPDVIRKYLRNSPCEKCKGGELCDTPCAVYWNWWDAKMEIIRRNGRKRGG